MKIKIVNSLGTFISDDLEGNTLEELFNVVDNASSGNISNLRVPIGGCHVFFGEELIKNSIITIIE